MTARIIGEIGEYPSSESVDAGIALLAEIGDAALKGETHELDTESAGVLEAAASAYIDPETPIEPQKQVEFMRAILGVLIPGTELPDMEGRQWASFWQRAEHHPELRFTAAPLMDSIGKRQDFVENARRRLPHDFTPHQDLTALRAPDPGTVIADLMENLNPEGQATVEREGELYVARYKSPWEIEEFQELCRRVLMEEGFRRDLDEAGRTIDEEAADGTPLARYVSPLRSEPVDRATYHEDMLTAGAAIQASNGTAVAINLMDLQQNAPREEATMGDMYPRISPVATPEAHIVGEVVRQVAHKPDMNMTINGVNESGWALAADGQLERHPRYVGTLRFRTDSPFDNRDYGHRIGAYARTWESKRNYMAVRKALAAHVVASRFAIIDLASSQH